MFTRDASQELRLRRTLCVCIAVAASAYTTSTRASEVLRGPYLQLSTPSSVVVVWRTGDAIEPTLRFGASPDALDRVVSGDAVVRRVSVDVAAETDEPFGQTPLLYDEPFAHGRERKLWDRNPSTADGVRQFEAFVENLEPSTRYYYGVYDGDRLLAGADEEHFFETADPAAQPADVRVWVVGDSGTGGRDQRRVFDAMRVFAESTNRKPDLFMHLGDMAYGDGADVEFQTNFFDIYQPTLRNTVCWPTMGNHEGHTSRGVSQFGPYYDAYVLPTRAEAGGVASGTEAYYAFDVGRAHFVCLDSHDLDRSQQGAMAKWLVADLEVARSDWLIAFWHHPPYTKGSHDSDRERQLIEMREWVMPLLESGGVDMVLSGHSHIYERSMLIDGAYATPTTAEGVVLDDGDGHPDRDGAYRKSAGLQPRNGVIAVVAGHGGAGVSRKGTMPIMREIIVENGSLILDIENDTLTGVMIDRDGAERDRFQVVKSGVVEHTPIADPWTPPNDPSAITEMTIWWTDEEVGGPPPGWRLVDADSGTVTVTHEEKRGYNYAAAEAAADRPLQLVYDGYEGRVAEWETYVHFPESGAESGGMIIGWTGPREHHVFELSPAGKTAALVRVRGDERETIARREVELDFSRPVKVELEFVERIIEVQLNDDLEYTINLEEALPGGRLGIALPPGGKMNFAGVAIEKAR